MQFFSHTLKSSSIILVLLVLVLNNSFGQSIISSPVQGITDFPDVNIFPSSNNQSELSISINNSKPNIIVASSNTMIGNTINQGRYVSTDAGKTWTGSDKLSSSIAVAGDPSTTIDANGNICIYQP